MRTLAIVDGRNFLYRQTDAHKKLSAEVDGETVVTGAIFGYLNGLLRLGTNVDSVVVAWESRRSFRKALFPEYKASRATSKSESQDILRRIVKSTEPIVKQMTSFMGIAQLYSPWAEADDVIATVAQSQINRDRSSKVMIHSHDSDLRALACKRVGIVSRYAGKAAVYDAALVRKQHGVGPRELPLLKALAGDKSDSIPGLIGIGPVKAITLVNKYKTAPQIISAAHYDDDWPLGPKFRKVVADGEAELELYMRLTRLKRVPLRPVRERSADRSELIRMLKTYKMRSFLNPGDLGKLMRLGRTEWKP